MPRRARCTGALAQFADAHPRRGRRFPRPPRDSSEISRFREGYSLDTSGRRHAQQLSVEDWTVPEAPGTKAHCCVADEL